MFSASQRYAFTFKIMSQHFTNFFRSILDGGGSSAWNIEAFLSIQNRFFLWINDAIMLKLREHHHCLPKTAGVPTLWRVICFSIVTPYWFSCVLTLRPNPTQLKWCNYTKASRASPWPMAAGELLQGDLWPLFQFSNVILIWFRSVQTLRPNPT